MIERTLFTIGLCKYLLFLSVVRIPQIYHKNLQNYKIKFVTKILVISLILKNKKNSHTPYFKRERSKLTP